MANVDPNNEATYRVVVVPNNLADAKKPEAMILKDVVACGFDEDSTFAIKLALEEAMTNAVRHGNAGDAGKTVTVRYAVSPEKVVICVRDEGPGFQPDCIPDPTHPDRLSLPCGRGIMLMKAYMNEVEYRCDGCEVRMMKLNPAIASDGSESESETSP